MRTLVHQSFTPTPNGLACDNVGIETIVEQVGTPTYIYSATAIREAYRAIDAAFAGYPHAIHYALKANSTLAIVRLLRSLGSRIDANSGGEIQVAQRAGYPPERSSSPASARRARSSSTRLAPASASSTPSRRANWIALPRSRPPPGREARVALRVNPDIDAGSHPNISTGLRINKFGVPLQDARAIYRERRGRAGLRFVGVHVHIGSQITTAEPLRRAARTLATLASELLEDGFTLEHVDVGGGLGIAYEGRPIAGPSEYADAVMSELRRSGLPVLLEPGRSIVGHAGALVARVVDTKRYPDGRQFAVLDAGMGELIRPALYGSFHRIVPVRPRAGADTSWDVVGPICESSDVFARDRQMPPLEVEDLVAILDAGAYGSVMASNYNRHLLPAEVLVDAGTWTVIRRRQTFDDVLALES